MLPMLALLLSPSADAFTICRPEHVQVLPSPGATDVPVDHKLVLLVDRGDACADDAAWRITVHDADGELLVDTSDEDHPDGILHFVDIALDADSEYRVTLSGQRAQEYSFATGSRQAEDPVDVDIVDLSVVATRHEGTFTWSPTPTVEPSLPDPDLLLDLAHAGASYQVIGTHADDNSTPLMASRRIQGDSRIEPFCITARSWSVAGEASEPSEACAEVDNGPGAGCGCASAPARSGLFALSALLLPLLLRRRRDRRVG